MIKFMKLNNDAIIPKKGSENSAGFDLYYCGENTTLVPGEVRKFDLGIASEFSNGYVGMICDRSGMGSKGVRVLGGIIDSDYRGEWKVILANVNRNNLREVYINKRDRIAQVLFLPIINEEIQEVNYVTESVRGTGGFGSTGV